MKILSDYTIYCTEEQTKKALELGAPIDIKYGSIRHRPSLEELKYLFAYEDYWYAIPTAEQMIGWLEEHNLFVNVFWEDCMYEAEIKNLDNEYFGIPNNFPTRKEATLAAIDAALEYLTNNNK